MSDDDNNISITDRLLGPPSSISISDDHHDKSSSCCCNINKKWIILFIVACGSFINGASFVFLSPIEKDISVYFNVTSTLVVWLVMGFCIIFLPSALLFQYLLNKYGLCITFNIGMLVQLLGSILRLIGCIYKSFSIMCIGQILFCGIAQCFYLVGCSIIGTCWFGSNNRDFATSIILLGYSFGSCCGQLTSPYIMNNDANNMPIVMIIQVCFTFIITILTLYFIEEKPKHIVSPSSKAFLISLKTKKSMYSVYEDFRNLFIKYNLTTNSYDLNYSYIILSMVIVLSQSIAIGLTNLDGDIASYLGHKESVGGLWGSTWGFGAMFGCVITGKIMDHAKYFHGNTNLNGYELLLRIIVSLELCTVLTLVYFLTYNSNVYAITVLFFIFGILSSSVVMLCTQTVIEITYPTSDTMAVGIMRSMENYSCAITGFVLNKFMPLEYAGYCSFHYIIVCIMILVFIFGFSFYSKLYRLEHESNSTSTEKKNNMPIIHLSKSKGSYDSTIKSRSREYDSFIQHDNDNDNDSYEESGGYGTVTFSRGCFVVENN